jgi:syntaxin 1B/2/3
LSELTHLPAIKGRMEKDIDEVGKVARSVKVKLEQMDMNVPMLPDHTFSM